VYIRLFRSSLLFKVLYSAINLTRPAVIPRFAIEAREAVVNIKDHIPNISEPKCAKSILYKTKYVMPTKKTCATDPIILNFNRRKKG
jgi:hypothetical protein